MGEGGRNGRQSYHDDDPQVSDDFDPRATSQLAAQIARRQALADRDIDRLIENVDRIERGVTDWQQHVKSSLGAILNENAELKVDQRAVFDEVSSLKTMVFYSKFVWPSATIMGLIVLGSCLCTAILSLFR